MPRTLLVGIEHKELGALDESLQAIGSRAAADVASDPKVVLPSRLLQ